jgi:hypothetical protein
VTGFFGVDRKGWPYGIPGEVPKDSLAGFRSERGRRRQQHCICESRELIVLKFAARLCHEQIAGAPAVPKGVVPSSPPG